MGVGLIAIFTTVVVAHFIALVSPGPDFLLVVKSAVRNRKSVAVGVALGIASANGIHIGLCILGVGAILSASLVAMTVFKLIGGAFLIYVAWQALRSKKSDYAFIAKGSEELAVVAQSTFLKEFFTGFISGISNPKNILFYLSLFSVVLTSDIGIGLKLGLGLWMTLLVFLWNAFIIYILSQEKVKSVFARFAFYVDKLAGTVLGLIGVKLLASALGADKRVGA